MSLQPIGFHAVLDCAQCDPASIKNETTIKSWISDVIGILATTAVGDVQVATTSRSEANEGLSAIQLTNNGYVSINAVNAEKHLYIDISSNKEISGPDIETATKKHFGSNLTANKMLVPRHAGATQSN